MEKTAFIMAIFAGAIFANVCCSIKQTQTEQLSLQSPVPLSINNSYGAYLAGRIAHLRHDLNTAADYYMLAEENAPDKQMLPSQLYVMLTSQGRVEEAVKYADKALQKNDSSLMIYNVKAVHHIKLQNYKEALENISQSDNPFAKTLLNPLMKAWCYAGLEQYDQAIKELKELLKNPASKGMYLLNAGMISDYLGKNDYADKYYSALIATPGLQFSSLQTQIIGNFYARQGNKTKMNAVLQRAENKNSIAMRGIIDDIKNMDTDTQPIMSSPAVGVSEALFNIALILQAEKNGEEVALLFASLASHLNPEYDMTQILLGSILNDKDLYKEANEIFSRIKPNKHFYYSAQLKIAINHIKLKNYRQAEDILQNLLKSYEPTVEVYTNLGEVMRLTKRYRDATIYYKKAMEFNKQQKSSERWSLLMMMAIAYDGMNDTKNAEQILREAISISPNPITQNHLGYLLLRDRRNVEEAFGYIVDAYLEFPIEASIIDSLGFAFYQIGNYAEAIKYLEEASALSPSEAVIYNHLGDAYWEAGRKEEAVFQWHHAMTTKDSFDEIDRDEVQDKIENGKKTHKPVDFDKSKLDKIIEKLNKQAEK